jgi:peptide deformylase
MSILKIASIGHPILRKKAAEIDLVDIDKNWFTSLIDDIIETREEYGGAGLAAPQVHSPWKIISVGYKDVYPNDPRSFPLAIIINPVMEHSNETENVIESCLSIPGMYGVVSRYKKVSVSGFSPGGEEIILENITGRLSWVLQHEIDHLDGILFVDRIADMRTITTAANIKKYGDTSLPYI